MEKLLCRAGRAQAAGVSFCRTHARFEPKLKNSSGQGWSEAGCQPGSEAAAEMDCTCPAAKKRLYLRGNLW
jgi:hypothetical protein